MIRDIRTRGLKRQQRLLRLAMRKLKRWGEEPVDADSDIAPLLECYQYTCDRVMESRTFCTAGLRDR
jgi:hypothetical protein